MRVMAKPGKGPLMPRLARLQFIPFGWYYVVLRSAIDRRIVTNRADLATALKLLRRTLRAKGARLHAGYIAEREVHLALQAGEVPLSAITGEFQHAYARAFNRAHHEYGSLFRLHYHVLLFQHQSWLVPLTHFIHWIRRPDTPDDCTGGPWWSSDAAYRGLEKQDWVTTNVVLRMLNRGAYSRHVPQEIYRRFFDKAPDPGNIRMFRHGSEEDPRLLGDAQFITDVWRRTGRRSPDRARRRTPRLEGDIRGVVMQVIEQFTALCVGQLPQQKAATWSSIVTYENLRSRSRRRPLPMLRALSVAYLVAQKIASPTQAAHFFGCGLRPVSARRRRFYVAQLHQLFGVKPEILFAPIGNDKGVRRVSLD